MKEVQIAILVLGIIGFAFSLLLALLSKKLKVEESPQAKEILEILPGLNCGACGFSGCRTYAEAVAKECDIFSGCLPGGSELSEKISKILGVAGCTPNNKQVVICRCGATGDEKKISSQYSGPETCRAANVIGGAIDCFWGCLGLSDCIEICPVKALSLKNKKIYVDIKKCIGCGKCIGICPRNLFELVKIEQVNSLYSVCCNNKEKALEVKKVCERGCIGCGICAKVSPASYFIEKNLSYVNRSKAKEKESLENGKNKCPTKCIFSFDV